METMNENHLQHITPIAQEDAAGLLKAHESYGNSWKKRGGVGAYIIMIRKFDRMELTCEKFGWNIFEAVRQDPRAEGIIDDIRDLRRYLNLIEAELRNLGYVTGKMAHRDNEKPATGGKVEDCDRKHASKDKYIHEHVPDGSCTCHHCRTMKALADTPHPDGCMCIPCQQLRRKLANHPKCSNGAHKNEN